MTSTFGINWDLLNTPTNTGQEFVRLAWSPSLRLFAAVSYGQPGFHVMTIQ